ncbi:MAG: gluconokinase [Gammaproteobacteria bacterium]|nr:gluconokinase [Gammaproteobacteria bacterium]
MIVMGVTGCGKSTVGAALAGRLNAPFLDADDYHPPANIEKMSQGIPLTDVDRWPWLDRLALELREKSRQKPDGIAVSACSALRRAYRERLIATAGAPILFIFLHGTREVIARRMQTRIDHFMPTTLLDSQLATLEPPAADENALSVDIGPMVSALAEDIFRQIVAARKASS